MARVVPWADVPEEDRAYVLSRVVGLLPQQPQPPTTGGSVAAMWVVYTDRPVGLVSAIRTSEGVYEGSVNFWERGPWVYHALKQLSSVAPRPVVFRIRAENAAAKRLLAHFGARRVKYGQEEVWIWD